MLLQNITQYMTFLTRFEFLKAVVPKIQVFCHVTLSHTASDR